MIKSSTYSLPIIGLVYAHRLPLGYVVAITNDSYIIFETLSQEYDSRVKDIQTHESPAKRNNHIWGLDKQTQELVESVNIVLLMTHKDKFTTIGINALKEGFLHGRQGTRKTLLARAGAAQTKSKFLKLVGPQWGQMFIREVAKLVRDAFVLAKEMAPSIIGGPDAFGNKRYDSEKAGDCWRCSAPCSSFSASWTDSARVPTSVMVATDQAGDPRPALLTWGRLDRTMEFSHADKNARTRIMQIHSCKMKYNTDVNFADVELYTDKVQRDAVQDSLPRGRHDSHAE